MILVRIKGGLGNQLFQYACGRSLAIEKQTSLALDLSWFNSESAHLPHAPREYLLKYLNISPETDVFSINESNQLKIHFQLLNHPSPNLKTHFLRILEKTIPRYQNWSWVQEHDPFKYNPDIFSNTMENIFLDGYWQNEAYFVSHKQAILHEFSPNNDNIPADTEISQRIQQSNAVSIHIRRGDYIKSEKTQAFHGVLSEKYYLEGIKKIHENVENAKFFVFSDDPDWCHNHLSLPIEYEIVSNNQRNAVDELFLMSKCKHHIIANSTFSWWAAWLNPFPKAITIAPSQWLQVSSYNPACTHWIKVVP